MVGRNERKAAVLGVLLRDGSITTRSLVERWNLNYSGAQASLERYRRSSLIGRFREPGPGPPVFRYRLLARFVRDPEVNITVSNSEYRRGVAQWLARFVRDEEAGGSSPLTPTIIYPNGVA